jgi:hypothetical protein
MNHRAASRAGSRIATLKNREARCAFFFCPICRKWNKLPGIHRPAKRDKKRLPLMGSLHANFP